MENSLPLSLAFLLGLAGGGQTGSVCEPRQALSGLGIGLAADWPRDLEPVLMSPHRVPAQVPLSNDLTTRGPGAGASAEGGGRAGGWVHRGLATRGAEADSLRRLPASRTTRCFISH